MRIPLALRVAVTLAALAAGAPFALAQRASSTPVRWRPSVRTSLHADPCRNPEGVPSNVTWFGSDGTVVQEERRTFCSPAEAEAALARRIERVGDRARPHEISEETRAARAATGREIWTLVPDTDVDVVEPTTPLVLHYIRLSGREYFDLFGADERHLRLVVEEMRRRGEADPT